MSQIGRSVRRKDGPDKVRGRVRYTDDIRLPGMLHAALLTSAVAHARIRSIDIEAAAALSGVHGVFTGDHFPFRVGLYLGDKPPLAQEKVRYYGEPVAAVVADDERTALEAVRLISVGYDELPVVRSPREALDHTAPLIHPGMADYVHIPAILPEPGSNVSHRTRIRKGDAEAAFRAADVTVEGEFEFPPGDHVAMEPRVAIAEVRSDGQVVIRTSTQSPYGVRAIMSRCLDIPAGRITIIAGPVGGGFGGKAGIQLEPLAYLLSRSVGGQPVRLANTREQDMVTSPGAPGLQSRVRLAARKDGTITAAQIEFLFDSGGYADYAVNVARAAGYACTGPYNIPNVTADSLSVYTNHPFATAYRGFGHIELSYSIERSLDLLAEELQLDPVELRARNIIRAGHATPSSDVLDENTGDLERCLRRAAAAIEWDAGSRVQVDAHTVRAKGVSCYWKAPAIPTFTDAAATVSFNEDASLNVVTGAVEIGQGIFTGLAQLAAERLGIDTGQVHVVDEVITDRSPHDWTTAASRTLFMAGRAVLSAIDDAVAQIKRVAAAPLRCPEEDLEVHGGRVFIRDVPSQGLPLEEVVLGYVYPNGNAIGGPIIGRGRYIARHLTGIDPDTGQGRPGLEWTLGAEGVEVEVDVRDGRYRVLRCACAMDVGKVINPELARGQVVGAMAMGIGYTTREAFVFDSRERVLNERLRDFKIVRYGEHPRYIVDFVETPQGDGPYDARGLGEQGIVGMPGALASAFSRAVGVQLLRLPITPEYLWSEAHKASGASRSVR
ncbi:MAG: xanthine dehydrogenase family protein molybdopterin-binding subunit [Spirochaetaceae bacterium]|nr:MAG: xanthine dehydrogenase family protein molybdopterin-binding subunit [Spirochaetaceae bacterium]